MIRALELHNFLNSVSFSQEKRVKELLRWQLGLDT